MDLSRYLPTLVQSTPADGAEDVPLNQEFELKFSVALHPSVCTPTDLDRYIIITDEETDVPVRLTLTYPSSPVQTDVVRFTAPLQPGRRYLLTVLPDLPAFTGRKAGVTRHLRFSTVSAASILQAPTLLEPGDNTQHTEPLELSWNAVATATGYEVQVCLDRGFDTNIVWSSTVTVTQVTVPAASLVSRAYHYWRVRAVRGADVSDWSEVRGFYFVALADVPSDELVLNQIISAQPDQFISSSSLDDYRENVSSMWPPLEFYGDITSAAQVELTRRTVDGFPAWQSYPVNFTFTLTAGSPDKMVITPSDPFLPNSVYTVRIRDGGKRYELDFVSYYDPFYASVESVLSQTRGLVEETEVDLHDLNFIIYKRSLDANRHYIRWILSPSSYGVAGPHEEHVRSLRIGNYYAVSRWVELISACDLLRRRMAHLAGVAGQTRRLGDYSEQNEGYALAELRKLHRELLGQAEMWLAEFSRMRGVVMQGIPGQFRPYQMDAVRLNERDIKPRDWRQH